MDELRVWLGGWASGREAAKAELGREGWGDLGKREKGKRGSKGIQSSVLGQTFQIALHTTLSSL